MLLNIRDLNNSSFTLPDDTVVLERIRAFVADAADCNVDQVDPDDDIYTTLHVDSLGAAAIFIDISYEFKIPEPDSETDFQSLNTPRKLLTHVKRQAGVQTASPGSSPAPTIPPDVLGLLPYGDAFRFVDSVLVYETKRIVTAMTWHPANPLISAHFADGPSVIPGVLIVEQVAQSALLLAKLDGLVSFEDHLLLAQLRCDFLDVVFAPATTQADVSFRAMSRGHFGFMGSCRDGQKEVARIKGIASRANRSDT